MKLISKHGIADFFDIRVLMRLRRMPLHKMNFHHGKLKMLTVVGGIALALTPCLQQTHAVCRLVGCIKLTAVATAESDGAQEVTCNRCCSNTPKSPCEKPPQHHGGDIPCGPYCWCSQAPDPREAPRNSTDFAKSSISDLHVEAPLTADIEGLFEFDDIASYTVETLPSLSAGDTCRLLCRYLT